ncbi:MAG: hypothetical protein AAGE59_20180 [Cyanobacteria bacterium P01_F01_bin.86]
MSDMLTRIKNRNQRPAVQRDTSLAAQDSAESSSTSSQASEATHEPKTIKQVEPAQSPAAELEEKLEQMPKVAPRRNIRLEESLDGVLQDLCNQTGVTIETFLEACYLACDRDPNLKQAVIKEADERLKQRKEAGKLRRLYSQLQKMGST